MLGLSLLPTASYAAALPIIKEEWALSATEAGIIFAAYRAGYVAATLLLLPLTEQEVGARDRGPGRKSVPSS